MNKYDVYEKIKDVLLAQNIDVMPYKEINYGIQFEIIDGTQKGKVRIYESKKKGVTVDTSQIKSETLKNKIILNGQPLSQGMAKNQTESKGFMSDKWEIPLIGVDESGKGDYFGPLVIAGVYADADLKEALVKQGVMDSKALSDVKIDKLAQWIKAHCSYEVIVIHNEKYNQLYNQIKNLNVLLAWGHARVIENLVIKTDSKLALSDQFGNESLIQRALMEKGKQITVEQRTKAEQNVVVAAASILARDAFVKHMSTLEKHYQISFPKGAGPGVVRAAKIYKERFGKEALQAVAKLHFKTTGIV